MTISAAKKRAISSEKTFRGCLSRRRKSSSPGRDGRRRGADGALQLRRPQRDFLPDSFPFFSWSLPAENPRLDKRRKNDNNWRARFKLLQSTPRKQNPPLLKYSKLLKLLEFPPQTVVDMHPVTTRPLPQGAPVAALHPRVSGYTHGCGSRLPDVSQCSSGFVFDNRWVVPYNPYLTMWYQCHINVEVCSSITVVKYFYKYVYKGHDRALAVVKPEAGALPAVAPQAATGGANGNKGTLPASNSKKG